MTLSFAVGMEPSYAAPIPQIVSAATFACSWIGATMPWTTPRCCAHSPTARTRGSEVTMASSTTIPRSTWSPTARARSTCGRMPTEMTTTSAGSSSPPASRTPSGRISSVLRSSRTCTPSCSIAGVSSVAAPWSSWRSIRRSMRCTTVVSHPSEASPYAASRPSSPPPITTALPCACSVIAAQSSGPRNTWACCAPGIGGTSASLPVQIT